MLITLADHVITPGGFEIKFDFWRILDLLLLYYCQSG